jgi:hypothetical protein
VELKFRQWAGQFQRFDADEFKAKVGSKVTLHGIGTESPNQGNQVVTVIKVDVDGSGKYADITVRFPENASVYGVRIS